MEQTGTDDEVVGSDEELRDAFQRIRTPERAPLQDEMEARP